MKICVLGAGVVGVSTAYALARQGHEVSVIDKNDTVARGASFANGAQLSYSYVDPFASPATLRQLPTYLSGLDPAVRLGLSLKPDYLSWGLRFMGECSHDRSQTNMMKRADLAACARQAMSEFMADCDPGDLNPTGQGKIVLASSDKVLDGMARSAREKRSLGIEMNTLTKDQCIKIEPALSDWQGDWVGGLYAADDVALNPAHYCEVLEKMAQTRHGVKFFFGETVTSLGLNEGRVTSVITDKNSHLCDKTVVCLGSTANHILKKHGLSAPIYPVQGYSLTLPLTASGPATSITDLKHKVVFAPLGDTLRIAGFMDTNLNRSHIPRRQKQLLDLAGKLWPSVADYTSEPNFWTDYRPMTPSGVPIIKESFISGLYLNIGHGALGYTFAPGSAMMIADMIKGTNSIRPRSLERKIYA